MFGFWGGFFLVCFKVLALLYCSLVNRIALWKQEETPGGKEIVTGTYKRVFYYFLRKGDLVI